jgi:hypothetical protein
MATKAEIQGKCLILIIAGVNIYIVRALIGFKLKPATKLLTLAFYKKKCRTNRDKSTTGLSFSR